MEEYELVIARPLARHCCSGFINLAFYQRLFLYVIKLVYIRQFVRVLM